MNKKKNFRGLFNKYHKGMPLLEILIKDFLHLIKSLKNFLLNGFNTKTIFIHPHYPSRGSTIYKISVLNNYNITNKKYKNAEFAIHWEYLTFQEEFELLEGISKNIPVINLQSRDISKKYIDKIHNDIFGYFTTINPESYTGKAVQKNDINAKHDGLVIDCPTSDVNSDYIYQLLIDNSVEDNLVKDFRVVVSNKVINHVYIKYRDIKERFKNTTIKTDLKNINEVFSNKEIDQLNNYCKVLNLNYGELDVLRNKNDGKIYVVDVNNTPQGPPANTSPKDGELVLKEIFNGIIKYSQKNSI